MISGALYHSDTIVFEFLLTIKFTLLAKPKSAILMLSKKIKKEKFTFVIHENVVRLDISVKDHVPVHDINGQ